MGVMAASAAASATWPEILQGTEPAVVISLHDLPVASGSDPADPVTDSTHEWNVIRARKIKVCLDDGSTGTAYVLMTQPLAGGM